MHIPDGWLSLGVVLVTWGLTLIAIGFALARFHSKDLDKLSNIGAIASVVFVAQMFNFPIAGGTSGHLLGSALSVYVVGLPGAILTLFVVLLVQAVVFADGGILALGANTFNMGITGAVVTYLILQYFKRFDIHKNRTKYLLGAFISAFSAVVAASFMAATELTISGTTTYATSLPPILFWHILIGIGEGLMTVFIISYLIQVDFPLDEMHEEESLVNVVRESNKPLIGIGVLLLLLSILALFASSSPDGLAFVGEHLGFDEGSSFSAGLADNYSFLGMDSIIGTILSALLGIVIISGLLVLPTFYLKERQQAIAV